MKATYKVVPITWKEIKPIWDTELWPSRDSKQINKWSWNIDNPTTILTDNWQLNSTPVFLGIKNKEGDILGVNSVYQSSEDGCYFRSRGLYIKPSCRHEGLAIELLKASVQHAEGAKYVWSAPRANAIKTYQSAGFILHGSKFAGTYGDNYFASFNLKV
jgi:GNAT superfamily N-acetyltransferase